MDDQPRNIIDGTARAGHWSRPRPNTARTDGDGAQARADAPKSIAASLLVPAEMLPVASPVDGRPNGDQDGGADPEPPGSAAALGDGLASEDTARQNPFLAPEAGGGSAAGSGRPAGRRSIVALLTRAIGAVNERRQMAAAPLRLVSVTPIRRLLAVRSIRLLAVALAAAAAIGLTVVILTGSNTAVSPSTRASLHGAKNVSSLDGRKSAPLAAAASPFPATHATRRATSTHPRQVQRHQTSNKRPNRKRSTRATSPGIGTAAVAASYTPPPTTSASTASSSDISGNASATSSAPADQPAAQPPSAPSTPAFGSSGALGPGSSPNG